MGPAILIVSVLSLIAAVLIVRSEIEKRRLRVSRYEALSGKIPEDADGKKIVFLSDLHKTVFGKANEKLIRRVLEEHPDVVILGGDMTTVKKRRRFDLSSLASLLEGIPAHVPVVAGSGNHEDRLYTEEAFRAYAEAYESLLAKHSVVRVSDGAGIADSFSKKTLFFGARLAKEHYRGTKAKTSGKPLFSIEKSEGDFVIALIHSPLYMEEAVRCGADLVFSGHFHGGTIYLPKLGGLMTPQFGFFEKKVRGWFPFGKGAGIVSAGLGVHSVPVRLNNVPEIVSVTLRRTEDGRTADCVQVRSV